MNQWWIAITKAGSFAVYRIWTPSCKGRYSTSICPAPASQLGQAGHLPPVNVGRIGEVTAVKLVRLLLEVGLNQGDLLAIRGIFCPDRLQTAVIQRLEDMHGLFEIEGHHLGAALLYLGLTSRGGGSFHAGYGPSHGHHRQERACGQEQGGLVSIP
jgi:hypothetical protein